MDHLLGIFKMTVKYQLNNNLVVLIVKVWIFRPVKGCKTAVVNDFMVYMVERLLYVELYGWNTLLIRY